MNFPRMRFLRLACVLLPIAASAWAGDLNKNYFGATTAGAWSEYLLTSPDGSKSNFSYQRSADNDGHPVVELEVKVLAGPGKDSKSKTGYILPRDFHFERDGLNYGRFTEKMTMSYAGNEMAVDATTLDAIKQGTKDFKGALIFEASEKIDGRACDRYSYSLKIGGPNPTQETGRLWMNPTVPFGMVRQSARITDPAGKLVTEFEMRLMDMGVNQALAAAAAPRAPVPEKKPPAPSQVSLADGFKAGRVGMDVEVVPGSSGRKLSLVLVNKTEANLTVTVPAGEMQFEVDSPVNTLQIATAKAAQISIPAGEKAAPIVVEQHAARGIAAGHCSLSVYEGTPLFSGSVTISNVPK
ncbi:MAG: hypothetical protein ABJF10_22505 [Chthoniobacter sp.]|uniref:hypothetical protein n=1 Tax=Chthoniobacter sp. TaxID=2510640 RepID=UPI0032AA3BF1